MRRELVLTNEAARHPFRASLPASVFRHAEIESVTPWRQRMVQGLKLERQDVKEFAATYFAAFLATTVFFM